MHGNDVEQPIYEGSKGLGRINYTNMWKIRERKSEEASFRFRMFDFFLFRIISFDGITLYKWR